jgi:hypothetical protein
MAASWNGWDITSRLILSCLERMITNAPSAIDFFCNVNECIDLTEASILFW